MVGRSDTGAVLGEGGSKQRLRIFAKAKVRFDRTEVSAFHPSGMDGICVCYFFVSYGHRPRGLGFERVSKGMIFM